MYNPQSFAAQLPDDAPIVLVIGAMASGSIDPADHPYVETEDMVSISEYPLSGACALNRIMGSIEQHWGIN